MKTIIRFLWIPLVFLIFGGWSALSAILAGTWEVIKAFFPLFGPAVLEDYFTSPYFLTGVVIAIASSCGIVLSIRQRKRWYALFSLLCLAASLVSICSNSF